MDWWLVRKPWVVKRPSSGWTDQKGRQPNNHSLLGWWPLIFHFLLSSSLHSIINPFFSAIPENTSCLLIPYGYEETSFYSSFFTHDEKEREREREREREKTIERGVETKKGNRQREENALEASEESGLKSSLLEAEEGLSSSRALSGNSFIDTPGFRGETSKNGMDR